jgi:hypothetical protein
VIGSLSGFETPVNLSAVRRVRMEKPGRLAHKGWLIGMRDTPLSIAEAVREMLSVKERKTELTLDTCAVMPGERATQITDSLLGIGTLLNLRAGRLLSATDIADLMEWLAPLSETKLDGTTVYGSMEWSPFLRRSATHALPPHWATLPPTPRERSSATLRRSARSF